MGKKTTAFALAALLMLGLTGCGSGNNVTTDRSYGTRSTYGTGDAYNNGTNGNNGMMGNNGSYDNGSSRTNGNNGLINVFNPELVVIGGELAMTGDYLLDPMRMGVNKHAIHLVSQDTRFCRGALGMNAGVTGACLVARSRYIGERFES